MDQTGKHIFISGAFGGLAKATIDGLIKNGWHVFASDINPEIMSYYKDMDQVTPLIMDVTDQKAIEEAYAIIKQKSDGLDAVITMSGILKIGSLVELSTEALRQLMEINLYGMYAVNKIFLPLLIKRKGRILTLSSEVGYQRAAPFNGLYSMSKHAVEAYSDALRRELAFINIKVIKIQPGPFKTPMTKNAELQFIEAAEHSVYFKANLKKGIPYLPKVYKNANDPAYVAEIILKALNAKNPKIAYSVKPDPFRFLLDKLPAPWVDWIIKKMLS